MAEQLKKLMEKFTISDKTSNKVLRIIKKQQEIKKIQTEILEDKKELSEEIEKILLQKIKDQNSPKEMEIFTNRSSNKDKIGLPFRDVIVNALAISSEDYVDHSEQIFFDRNFYEKTPSEFESFLKKAWDGYAEVKFFEGGNPEKVMAFWFRLLI